MKSPAYRYPLASIVACFALLTAGSSQAADPIADAFFPPELIGKMHEQLGLSEDQGTTLQNAFQETQQRIQTLQQDMQREAEKLAELAKPEKVEEKAVAAQADKVLDLERQMKHAQLSLLVLIKNTLTAEQQAKLREVKAQGAGIEAKMKQVQEAVQKWQQGGRDLSPLQPIKTEMESAMAQGKFAEVNAALDRALKILNGTPEK
jgi:Spy/CpxP family protein refolding chaperone